VIELDAGNNRVIVAMNQRWTAMNFSVERCNWIPFDTPPETLEVTAKIRYQPSRHARHRDASANGVAKVKLLIPQRAITPGRSRRAPPRDRRRRDGR